MQEVETSHIGLGHAEPGVNNDTNGDCPNGQSVVPRPDCVGTAQDRIGALRELLGEDVVLLPIAKGGKASFKGWQKTTVEAMGRPDYLARLSTGGIGVLLGKPSNGLCCLHIDQEEEADRFLELNPLLRNTLQSRGKRGLILWVRVGGDFPQSTKLNLVRRKRKSLHWGEWRATGSQSAILGPGSSKCDDKILQAANPVEVPFDSIVWPDQLDAPWGYAIYDELVSKQGKPYAIQLETVALNQPFFVSKYAEEHLVLHEPDEREFYAYDEGSGLWVKKTIDKVKDTFSLDLKVYADTQGRSSIERKRTNELLAGLASQLKGRVEKKEAFARTGNDIHVLNGVVRLDVVPPELREFSPSYYSRNQCTIKVERDAKCPRFINELLTPALDIDDISLIQRWCGSVLLGRNQAQKLMLLLGTGGAGKSTFVEILEKVMGADNVAELRTEHLNERFEIYRFIGKTLLTGKDVAAEFLMHKGTSMIKKLVGNDLITAEAKNSNGKFNIRGIFGMVITCNTRLKVRLEGDADAWRRRLLIIEWMRSTPARVIPDFGDLLIREEGPGILLWMIRGAVAHMRELKEHGGFVLTEKQRKRVDLMLAESDSIREFVRSGLKKAHPGAQLPTQEIVIGYIQFCLNRGWQAVAQAVVEKELPSLIEAIHGLRPRHDLTNCMGVSRGYKGLELVSDSEP